MARPPQANAERTRARILTSASKLFSDKGAGNTSMREIAKKAGVTQATVHHYFGSKEDLHLAAVQAMYAELGQLREETVNLLEGSPDTKTFVDRAIRSSFQFARQHIDAVRLALREVIDMHDLPPAQTDQLSALLRDAVPPISMLTQLSERRTRFVLQSLVFLIVRYAIGTAGEYSLVAAGKFNRRKRHDEEHVKAIEDELVAAAQAMLGL